MKQSYVWQTLYQPGLEHCQLIMDADGTDVDGVVIGVEDGQPFRLIYLVRLSAEFRFRSVEMISITDMDRQLSLHMDDDANWLDKSGAVLPDLHGCLDIDISITPFTNALPVWRLQLAPGESTEINVVYISVPTLKVSVARQRYTLLDLTDDGRTYRFDSLDSDFTALVQVDNNGVVTNYEGLFERL